MNDYYEKQVIASHQNPEAREYWQKKLSGNFQKSYFPYDHKENGEERTIYDSVRLNFDQELCSKLISASKNSDHALHVILSAGLAFLLAKYDYKSNKDIILGAPIYKQEMEGEGEFINAILPLRLQVKDRWSFKDLLMEMKQTVLDAVKHQNYPVIIFSWELDLLSKTSLLEDIDFPLFDSAIFLENIHEYQYLKYFRINTVFSFSRPGNNGIITGEIKYNTRRYKKSTMEQIATHFTALMKKTLFNANLELSAIDILGESERKRLLDEFNNSKEQTSRPGDRILHELFEDQVRQTPDRTAALAPVPVITDRAALMDIDMNIAAVTYKELDDKAGQLARVLRAKGIQPDTIAALSVERSIDMVIGILAILKAGGAYLPIEPAIPDDRVNYMLADARPALLLTTRYLNQLSEKFRKKDFELEKVFIEEQFNASSPYYRDAAHAAPFNLAYVIYTSGTTGRPKAAAMAHKGVVNYTRWRIETYGITGGDVTLQLLSYAFDGFGSNFYSSLFSGGVLLMIPGVKKLDYEYIRKFVREKQVTNISLVPGMYEALLTGAEPLELESLRFVVLGGEKAAPRLIERSKKTIPGIRHIIEYGPTEAAVCAVANVEVSPAETAIIGKPIANSGVYILDHFHEPQPLGVTGELCITGAGIARGYLNNPDLTAEKFDHDLWDLQDYHDRDKKFTIKEYNKKFLRVGPGGAVFSKSAPPGRRRQNIYKSGDLARWLSDGKIEFLGRKDQQIKIRGFRVEPVEIEALMHRHEAVEQCIIIAREIDGGSEMELIAYYKMKKNKDISSTRIREFLADELPDYMMPSFLIQLDEFPLTSNGKIDKKALVVPERIDTGTDLVKPRNEIEKRILEVFKQVIGIEDLGVGSGFFDVGGTSMKAIFAEAHLSKELNITVEHFYQYRSIQEIAKNVTWKKESLKAKIEGIKMELTRIEPGSDEVIRRLTREIEKEYSAYIRQIQKQTLPGLSTAHDYRHIFLTGGTGYLGAHLIYELLQAASTRLHLLVRGDTPEDATERLKQCLDFYFGENFFETNSQRLQVVVGDLRGEELGIDDSIYSELCHKIDAVVHAASNTMEFGLYEDFYKVNVLGTENLLELAEKGKKKDFHYISTMEVAHGNIEGKQAVLFTELCHDLDPILNDYTRSFWEAEKKALAWREKGMNVSIYRVGNLTFHSHTGKTRVNIEKDRFAAQLKAFIILGKMPGLKKIPFDLSFVNHTVAAIVKLLTRENTKNQTHHLYNHNRLTWDHMALLMEKAGIPVQVVSLEEFLDYLSGCIDEDENTADIVRLMRHTGLFKKEPLSGETQTLVRVVSDRTERILKQVGFQWEKVNQSHIEKVIQYGRQKEFFP